MKNKYIITIIIIALITGLYFLGKHFMKPKYGEEPTNPYDLKIDSIGQIDKEKYCNYSSAKIKLDLKEPKAVGIGFYDLIYVSGDNKIQIFDTRGSLISEFQTSETATSIAISENNELYLGINDHIEKYDNTGNLISKWESLGEKAYITSVTINDKKVFLAEAEAELVYAFNTDGKKLDIYGDSVPVTSLLRCVLPSYYFDVAIDPEGFLWIANTGKHKLVNLNASGELRSYWGVSSSSVEGFCGCCNPTHFNILEDGSFITSEKGIIRVKKYDAAGQFVCAVAGPEHFAKGSVGLDIAIDSKQNIYVLEPKAKVIHIFKEK